MVSLLLQTHVYRPSPTFRALSIKKLSPCDLYEAAMHGGPQEKLALRNQKF